MPQPPQVADTAPAEPFLTGYDEQHLVTYLRLLDADAEGADWREVASIVLKIDPEKEPQRAKRVWESHLARAKWMTETGYRHLLRGGGAELSHAGPWSSADRPYFPAQTVLRRMLATSP